MTDVTDFRDVVYFNQQFGVLSNDWCGVPVDLFDQEGTKVHDAMQLVREELQELEEAVKQRDYLQTADALIDSLYVVYGLGAKCGFDMDPAWSDMYRQLDLPTVDPNPEYPVVVKLALSLIREQMHQLETVVRHRQLDQLLTKLLLMVQAIHLAAANLGIDMKLGFRLVHQHNLSKLCRTEAEAQQSVEHYRQSARYQAPHYRLAPNGSDWVVYDQITHRRFEVTALDSTPSRLDTVIGSEMIWTHWVTRPRGRRQLTSADVS